MSGDAAALELRVLMLAPTSRDAELSQGLLRRAGIDCLSEHSLQQLCQRLDEGAGALLVPEEAIAGARKNCLVDWLARQPPWSDLPLLVLTWPGADSAAVGQAMDLLGNVTVVERPTRVAELVSLLRSALRARQRQYQLRDHLDERERHHRTTELMAAIVTSSDDAIISTTMDGTILTWNAGAEALYGYSAAEIMGQSVDLLIPPDRPQEGSALLERLRCGERIQHFETLRMHKNGQRVDVSLSVSPLLDSAGRLAGASKVARDISQRKKDEAALIEADRRKDLFLATLAHELRNPLAPISNALEILRLRTRQDEGVDQLTAVIGRQLRHLVRLVDDLLEISRINRGHIELKHELIDVAELINTALETSRPLIDAAHHQLKISMPAEPMRVRGDPVRLAQILSNLINNSAKYTHEGGLIAIGAQREADGRVAITVSDNGLGIAAESLPSVFEPFVRLQDAKASGHSGLGIGLALVKTLVEMHGGSVEARSGGSGLGSSFTIRLKGVDTARGSAAAQDRPLPGATVMQQQVLVVDDNRDAAQTLGALLKLLGAEVRIAHDGAQALQILKSFRPGIAFLDIGMPEMDGHQLAARIRRQPEFSGLMLVAVTGWGQDSDRRETQKSGFDHHLVKPAGLDQIRELFSGIGPAPPARHLSLVTPLPASSLQH